MQKLRLIISLNQIVAFSILVMLFAQTFSKTFIVFDYYTNTATYAKSCVNKSKPWMHCNGKCQMMKKMQQEDTKDQQNPERKTENKQETVLSSKSFFAAINAPFFTLLYRVKTAANTGAACIGRPYDIFHPPQA